MTDASNPTVLSLLVRVEDVGEKVHDATKRSLSWDLIECDET